MTHLNACLRQFQLQRQMLARKDVRILALVERLLQLMQLVCGECGARSACGGRKRLEILYMRVFLVMNCLWWFCMFLKYSYRRILRGRSFGSCSTLFAPSSSSPSTSTPCSSSSACDAKLTARFSPALEEWNRLKWYYQMNLICTLYPAVNNCMLDYVRQCSLADNMAQMSAHTNQLPMQDHTMILFRSTQCVVHIIISMDAAWTQKNGFNSRRRTSCCAGISNRDLQQFRIGGTLN